MLKPIEQCYWAVPGQLLAGEYPGDKKDPQLTEVRIRSLLEAGIRRFIDLTEMHDSGGMKPYEQFLKSIGAEMGVSAERVPFPLRDQSVPRDREQLRTILDGIDEGLNQGKPTYVHCWGGRGRTGLVMACWFIRHGLTNEEALVRVNELWKTVPKSAFKPESPELDIQVEWVRGWSE